MPKKILILAANPKNTHRLRLDEEVREIEDGLRRSKNRNDYLIYTQVAVRLRDLRRAMLEYEPQIAHFSGHGTDLGIMLEDELGNAVPLSPEALAGLFELFKDSVVCVLLNSCYSESQAAAINEHIPYVIGMSHRLDDKAALEFAIGFYDALGAGKSIEEAFRFGCNAIQLYGFPKKLNPVLMIKSNQILQQKQKAGESVPTEIAIDYVLKFAQDNAQPGNWAGFNRLVPEIGTLLWAVGESYHLEKWKKVLEFRRALGDFLYWKGFWNEALQIGKWSFEAADRSGDQKEKAWCALYPLARVSFYKGNYEQARNWSEQSLTLFKQQRDDYGAAAACRYLGRAYQAVGDLEMAERLFHEGYEKVKHFNMTDSQKNLQGHLLASLASVHFDQAQYQDARQKCTSALALYTQTQDLAGIGTMLHHLGKIAVQLGEYPEAEKLLAKSLESVESIRSDQLEADIYYSQALLAEKQGRPALAQEKLQAALERFESLQAAKDVARTQKALLRNKQVPDHL